MEIEISKVPAYYINLRHDAARRKQVEASLAWAGFTDTTWVSGVRGKTRALGCALAHRSALEVILERDVFPCVVVEDDILPYEKQDLVLVPDNADALYVGISQYGIHGGVGIRNYAAERIDKNISRISNMLAAHGVMYFNKEYVEFLIRINKIFVDMKTNQDKGRAETMKYWNVYALNKPMFYQGGKYEQYTKFEIPDPFMRSLDFFYTG